MGSIFKGPLPYMAFNFMSSVGIININKLVFKEYGFTHNIFLTGLHFTITFLGLLVCNQLGMFKIKRVPMKDVLVLSITFCGFVVFNNLSLQYNSLGFYQLAKVLTTPVIAIIQLLHFKIPLHPTLQKALLPVCAGVILATVNDVEMNFWGSTFALLGILSTSFYQLFVKSKQQDLGLGSMQLLFYQAPVSAVFVFMLSLVMDPPFGESGWVNYDYNQDGALAAICASCALAFCVNLSIFLVIGKTDAISYNVLGHFKLVCILLSGVFIFHEDTNAMKMMGTVLAFIGVVLYTHYKQLIPSGWETRLAKTHLAGHKNDDADPPATQSGTNV